MKVIVPVLDKDRIADGFNYAAGVCVCDLSATPSESCAFGLWKDLVPQGAKIAGRFKELGIQSVLASRMQMLALNFFTSAGINVYKSCGDNLQENLSFMRQNLLEHLSAEDALKNGSACAAGACASCTSASCKT